MNDEKFLIVVIFGALITQMFFKEYKGSNVFLKFIKNLTENPYSDASKFMKNAFGFMWFAGIWVIGVAVFNNI